VNEAVIQSKHQLHPIGGSTLEKRLLRDCSITCERARERGVPVNSKYAKKRIALDAALPAAHSPAAVS